MDYYDLGGHGRPVTTSSPEAQRWFDRGLVWTYAFHHEEAVACFEAAVAADPDCAMAHWGIAHALGPNYNKPWEAFDAEELTRTVDRTHAAVERAHDLAGRADPVERALVGALRARYPGRAPSRTARSGTSRTPTACAPCTNWPPTTWTWPPSTRTP